MSPAELAELYGLLRRIPAAVFIVVPPMR